MKYLKLYESVKDLGFSEISSKEWIELCNRLCNIDKHLLTILPSDVRPEIGRTQNNKGLIDFIISNIDIKDLNKSFAFFIYEFDDEYYGIHSTIRWSSYYHIYRFKCDQIDGLLNCINYIKEHIYPQYNNL